MPFTYEQIEKASEYWADKFDFSKSEQTKLFEILYDKAYKANLRNSHSEIFLLCYPPSVNTYYGEVSGHISSEITQAARSELDPNFHANMWIQANGRIKVADYINYTNHAMDPYILKEKSKNDTVISESLSELELKNKLEKVTKELDEKNKIIDSYNASVANNKNQFFANSENKTVVTPQILNQETITKKM